jgi:hypothetical protein
MDRNIAEADPTSVTLLRLTIEHCLRLADEEGLTEAGLRLHQALGALGGSLVHPPVEQ